MSTPDRPDRPPREDVAGDERLTGRKADEVDVVDVPERPSSRRIWGLFLAGPTLWFAHFMLVYLVVEAVCAGSDRGTAAIGPSGLVGFTIGATVLATVAILGATWSSHRRWRIEQERFERRVDELAEEASAARGHDRELAFGGFLLGPLSVLAVLIVGLPALWIGPC